MDLLSNSLSFLRNELEMWVSRFRISEYSHPCFREVIEIIEIFAKGFHFNLQTIKIKPRLK